MIKNNFNSPWFKNNFIGEFRFNPLKLFFRSALKLNKLDKKKKSNKFFLEEKVKGFFFNTFRKLNKKNFKKFKLNISILNNFLNKFYYCLRIKPFPIKYFKNDKLKRLKKNLRRFGRLYRRFAPSIFTKNTLSSDYSVILKQFNSKSLARFYRKKLNFYRPRRIPANLVDFKSFFDIIFNKRNPLVEKERSTLTRFVRISSLFLFDRYRKYPFSLPSAQFLELVTEAI